MRTQKMCMLLSTTCRHGRSNDCTDILLIHTRTICTAFYINTMTQDRFHHIHIFSILVTTQVTLTRRMNIMTNYGK
jgi:hypothetical protein